MKVFTFQFLLCFTISVYGQKLHVPKLSIDHEESELSENLNYEDLARICECNKLYSNETYEDMYTFNSSDVQRMAFTLYGVSTHNYTCDANGDGSFDVDDLNFAFFEILSEFEGQSIQCDRLPEPEDCRAPIRQANSTEVWDQEDQLVYASYSSQSQHIFYSHNSILSEGMGKVEIYTAPISRIADSTSIGVSVLNGFTDDDLGFAEYIFTYQNNEQVILDEFELYNEVQLSFSTWGEESDAPLVSIIDEHIAQCEHDLAYKTVPVCTIDMPGASGLFEMKGKPQYGTYKYGAAVEASTPYDRHCQN
jgi:hypothetical protein